jgi:hypothetical protein
VKTTNWLLVGLPPLVLFFVPSTLVARGPAEELRDIYPDTNFRRLWDLSRTWKRPVGKTLLWPDVLNTATDAVLLSGEWREMLASIRTTPTRGQLGRSFETLVANLMWREWALKEGRRRYSKHWFSH